MTTSDAGPVRPGTDAYLLWIADRATGLAAAARALPPGAAGRQRLEGIVAEELALLRAGLPDPVCVTCIGLAPHVRLDRDLSEDTFCYAAIRTREWLETVRQHILMVVGVRNSTRPRAMRGIPTA
ncbi:hypothetical protein [Pseudonocardia sp. GCM10023141]|uniref:hypothetical protein n=1 Tax=Pseudonocardia sp. GCM10023141 TaxID=3252653 RepID=UPI00361F3A93